MFAKYLRELAMIAFNQFWQRHVPNLRPTAGYPVDAKRFRREIRTHQRQLHITDQMLWGDLKPGERSALFVKQGRFPVYFFYLNTAPPDSLQMAEVEAEPTRIELPEWVAMNNGKLNLVHALVYDQCRMNNGYPYVLTRADELAVILNEEREALETMILQAVSRHEMPMPRFSHKAAQKRIARGQFRRR